MCGVSSRRSRFGTHSSSNTRIGERQISGLLKGRYRHFARYTWKIFQKFIQRITTLEVVKQCLTWYASAG